MYLSEAKASHSHKTWTKFPFSAPHLLQKGLLISTIIYRYLLSLLCQVRRPVTTLVFVPFKDRNLVLGVGVGPEISFQACLCVMTATLPYADCPLSIYLFPYILLRDPQGQIRSNKLVDSSISCELVSNFISTYSRLAMDPKQSHRMLAGNVVQCLLALLYQWGYYFGSLKGFQSHLTDRSNTNIFLWSNIDKNFTCTGQDSIYLGLENSRIFS
jgi:hypothetical protein